MRTAAICLLLVLAGCGSRHPGGTTPGANGGEGGAGGEGGSGGGACLEDVTGPWCPGTPTHCCDSWMVCANPEAGVCLPPCTTDADCQHEVCDGHYCVKCNDTQDCGRRSLCVDHPKYGSPPQTDCLATPCFVDADCPSSRGRCILRQGALSDGVHHGLAGTCQAPADFVEAGAMEVTDPLNARCQLQDGGTDVTLTFDLALPSGAPDPVADPRLYSVLGVNVRDDGHLQLEHPPADATAPFDFRTSPFHLVAHVHATGTDPFFRAVVVTTGSGDIVLPVACDP